MPKCHSKSLILSIFLFLFNYENVEAEVFTAVADLEELLNTESVLINTLENYIRAEEQKLELLKRYAEIYQRQHNRAAEDVQLYLSNPINAYTLVKRLTADWAQVETLIGTNINEGAINNITYFKQNMEFPTDEDLNGAAVALTRLQDTYKLDTSSLARGELNGVKYSAELTAADCFELGRQSYNNGDFYHTLLWMKEAEARMRRESNETVAEDEILEYIAFCTYKQGDIQLALDITNKLLELAPAHPRATGNKVYYEDELAKVIANKSSERKMGDDETDDEEPDDIQIQGVKFAEPEEEIDYDSLDSFNQLAYEALCRCEIQPPVEETSKLKCRYVTNNNPFLLIAPFKIEEAHLDPDLFVFHDVMYDEEIQVIKTLAHPRFRRATVQNSITGELETAQYRISKSAWLEDEEHKYIKAITQRITDMTGLMMETAEELQVANYGVGGHYEPHYDFARKDDVNAFKNLNSGNRIATVLFYMSDVPQGGATVFPFVKTALLPRKGTAAFWYNLFPSGDGDARTRHAACPVLAGSKWVSNKWIHEKGQEFLRPCTLEPPPEQWTI